MLVNMGDEDNSSNTREISSNMIDVVIVGAGFAGLYMLYRLRQNGFSTKVIEVADGIGGVWYWNGYPGARCDIEAVQYSYSFSEELQQEWKWSELLPAQPEISRYLNYVADKFDLRKNIELGTRVNTAIFDENHCRWEIHTSRGDRISAKFCIMATGCLSAPQMPHINGLETFNGHHYHTGRWPQTDVNFSGRRVAIFGTGSSGVQAIPVIAEQAKHIFVFQRTANFSVPARNKPLEPEYERWWKSNYAEHRKQMLETITGYLAPGMKNCSTMSLTPEERSEEYEKQWQKGSLNFLASFNDLVLNQEANDTAAEFLRSKIRQIVKDPIVAEKLIPRGFPLVPKRICLDTDYFETFNRNNVTLLDLRQEPIDKITPTGISIGNKTYELDDIVFATGFDAITGALLQIDIRGRAGKTLRDKWIDGPCTYLGLMTSDLPNLFMITGPGSPAVFANAALCIEQHVDWITDCLVYIRTNHYETIEPNAEAENDWGNHVNAVANFTLFPKADCWYNGANIEGKPKIFMPYAGGVSNYRKKCQDVATNGYKGFILAAH
jgi:cyclohexanone monooxygenase